jgi:KDO2-lipid IV(A) lauroyltransferase
MSPRKERQERTGPEAAGPRAPTLRDRIEYAAIRLLTLPLLCTDVHGAARIGRVAARLLPVVDAHHRRITLDNLRRAYAGEKGEEEVRALARRVYEDLGTTVAEILHGPRRIRGRAFRKWFRVEMHPETRAVLAKGPIIFLGGHLGNWEHIIPGARAGGVEVLTVARPLANPLVDRWVVGMRHAIGHFSLPKEGALRGLIRTLREGKCVGMLVDQNGGRGGTLSTFFGRPVSTQAAGVSLARRLGVPFAIGTIERRAPGFHRFTFGRPVYVRDDDAGEQEAVDEMNRRLESWVRRRPESWMWLHRRWRIKADWGFPAEPTEGKRKP